MRNDYDIIIIGARQRHPGLRAARLRRPRSADRPRRVPAARAGQLGIQQPSSAGARLQDRRTVAGRARTASSIPACTTTSKATPRCTVRHCRASVAKISPHSNTKGAPRRTGPSPMTTSNPTTATPRRSIVCTARPVGPDGAAPLAALPVCSGAAPVIAELATRLAAQGLHPFPLRLRHRPAAWRSMYPVQDVRRANFPCQVLAKKRRRCLLCAPGHRRPEHRAADRRLRPPPADRQHGPARRRRGVGTQRQTAGGAAPHLHGLDRRGRIRRRCSCARPAAAIQRAGRHVGGSWAATTLGTTTPP